MYTGMTPSAHDPAPAPWKGVGAASPHGTRPLHAAGVTRQASQTPQAGVTLIELLVVIAVAAILTFIAIPSYKTITTSARITGEINGLLGDMQFARAEAIKEGQSVTICISSNQITCDSSNTAWQSGWIVFQGAPTSSAPNVLRLQAAFSGSDTLVDSGSSTSAITFGREGIIGGWYSGTSAITPSSNTLITLHDSTANTHYTRCLQISPVGAMQVVQNSNNGSCT